MPQRSDSVDSTYILRKNPLNIRNIDGSDLILTKIDRLGQMASTQESSSNDPSKMLEQQDPFGQFELTTPTTSSKHKSHPSQNFSLSSMDSMYSKSSNATAATFSSPMDATLKEPLSVVLSRQEKRNSAEIHSNQSSPSKVNKLENPIFAALQTDEVKQHKPQLKTNVDLQPPLEFNSPDGNILAGLPLMPEQPENELPSAPISTSTSSASAAKTGKPMSKEKLKLKKATERFFPLELSLATDDFSSLILKDFSRSTLPYSLPQTSSNTSSSSSLQRKNTITSQSAKVHTSASTTSPLLFERMRSVRRMGSKEAVLHSNSSLKSVHSHTSSEEIEVPESAAASVLAGTPLQTTQLDRGLSNSSNFTTWSNSTSSSQDVVIEKELPAAPTKTFTPPVTSSLLLPDGPTKYANPPARSLSSASQSSSSSFESHIAQQLCTIPSPVLNAITFTPPMGAVIVSSDEDDDVEALSIFSQSTPDPNTSQQDSSFCADETLKEEIEDEVEEKEPENPIDPEDRGRLFVRVEGLQGLQLPLIRFRNPKFNMTLDNGVQSVTIDKHPINTTNPGVGQEFELVVGEDLQFILTFQAFMDPISTLVEDSDEEDDQKKREDEEARLRREREEMEKAKRELRTPQSSPKKQSRFRSMFSSPKKKNVEEAANQQGLSLNGKQVTATTKAIENTRDVKHHSKSPKKSKKGDYIPRDAWDGLIGPRGEFGRCYLVESQYEKEVYGRPRTFNVTLFNEWSYTEVPIETKTKEAEEPLQPSLAELLQATNKGVNNSSRNKKHGAGALLKETENSAAVSRYRQQQAKSREAPVKYKKVPVEPYKIASLQITMMYIPRATMDGALPFSMKAAIKELNLAKTYKNIALDGFLSQLGGDCHFWRRRWFTLRGAEIVGHTEDTKKVRTVLNLANVESVLDTEQMSNQDKREMMASCMYSDRSFKMSFKDGEVILFYADSVDAKDAWMEALDIAIKHCTGRSFDWTDVVMGYHEYEKIKLIEEKKEKKAKRIAKIKELEQATSGSIISSDAASSTTAESQ